MHISCKISFRRAPLPSRNHCLRFRDLDRSQSNKHSNGEEKPPAFPLWQLVFQWWRHSVAGLTMKTVQIWNFFQAHDDHNLCELNSNFLIFFFRIVSFSYFPCRRTLVSDQPTKVTKETYLIILSFAPSWGTTLTELLRFLYSVHN